MAFHRYPQIIQMLNILVRSSTQFYLRFNLSMDRSPGFGSTAGNWVGHLSLAFTAPPPYWLKLATNSNSLDRSTKSTPSPLKVAPTPCTHTVSGSISLPFRGSFHLSLTLLVHYRSQNIFSLGRRSSQLQTGFLVPRPTQEINNKGWSP